MNKPNKTELEYFIRYSLDSDKYKRYMELYDEIERLKEENTILKQTMSNNSLLINENAFLKERISKAIEYIEEKYDYILGDDTFLDHDERIDRKQINHIIEILKGVDKE